MVEFIDGWIFINGKKAEYAGFDTADGTNVFCANLQDIQNFQITDFPSEAVIFIDNINFEFEPFLLDAITIFTENNQVILEFQYYFEYSDWAEKEMRWSPEYYFSTLVQQTKYNEFVDGEFCDNYSPIMTLKFKSEGLQIITELFQHTINTIKNLVQETEIALSGGLIWRKEYEFDENLFCEKVVAPLLRRMGFSSVRYQHGKKEYGKDFTFSEATKFGEIRYYGLQAKAGSISGKVNSKIDELLGQLNDAFSMPYYEIGSKTPRYISTFVIAISGYFKENAKEKIIEKMPKGIIGSVYFWDKEKITELVEKYWFGNNEAVL